MYPTRGQVKTRFQNLLDDPSGQVFNESVFAEAFSEAYDALFTAFLTHQVPRIELVVNAMVVPGTPSLTPAQMGITDWGDYIYLAERLYGSNGQYRDLIPVDRFPARPMSDRLLEFTYRNDTFYFGGGGATTTIDLQVKYDSSGTAPTNDGTTISVDGALTFLGNYAAGAAGGRKGYNELAARSMSLAVGPRYDEGVIGGELFRLVQARVRSRQKVQIAPKPYSIFRRFGARRATPYVAAQMGTTGGTWSQNAPVQFSTANGSIVGAIDGVNAVFTLNAGGVAGLIVYRNGLLKTSGTDFAAVNNRITFLPGSVPQPGDIVTAEAYF